jgi:HAD superfamily hydrolase (TIGR01509 family)
MKTILVDAWNTFVTSDGINNEMQQLLDTYKNPKIIVTNANADELITFGIVNMPYPVFSLAHNPNKSNPSYFEQLLSKYSLSKSEVIYFEHNEEAFNAAQSLNIKTLWLKSGSPLIKLKQFLDNNL